MKPVLSCSLPFLSLVVLAARSRGNRFSLIRPSPHPAQTDGTPGGDCLGEPPGWVRQLAEPGRGSNRLGTMARMGTQPPEGAGAGAAHDLTARRAVAPGGLYMIGGIASGLC
jgi:hypothetical protein